jgi:parvulin-like peptidyl-prolyl isomerase
MCARSWIAPLAVCLVISPAAWAQSQPKAKENAQAIAATVNGQTIPEAALVRSLKRLPPEKMAEARLEVLNFLIDNLLIDQYLTRMPVTVDPAEVEAKVKQVVDEIKKQGSTIDQVLHELNVSQEELRTQITAQLRWEEYTAAQATDKNLREFFSGHRDMFDGSLVHARHILLAPSSNTPEASAAARDRLLAIRKSLEEQAASKLAGRGNVTAAERDKERVKLIDEGFASIAGKESACPSKQQGGDLGWFPRAGTMVEPFAKAAFALQPGQMSDIVSTQFGHHLILVTERKPGHDVKFDEVKDEVKEVFSDRLREDLCARLRPTAVIIVNSPPK